MISHTGVTPEIMENIDPQDTMTPIDIVMVINVTALDRLINSRDTNREAQTDTETTLAIIMIAHAHQVVSSSKIDAHDGITNIHVLICPYVACHVLDVAVHNIHLQVKNVPHNLKKSRRT